MQTKSWHLVDKSTWPAGPWQDEPDKLQWQDVETGLPCLIVRNNSGALCGYVGVSAGHVWFERYYSNYLLETDEEIAKAGPAPEDNITIHGGLTFSSKCSEIICHEVDSDEPDDIWWFGFDCSHCDDISPKMGCHFSAPYTNWPRAYRTLSYVQQEVANLARQLKAVV